MRLRRYIAKLLLPLFRWILRRSPPENPSARVDFAAPLAFYGSGARYDFPWYFEGESRVKVSSLPALNAVAKRFPDRPALGGRARSVPAGVRGRPASPPI